MCDRVHRAETVQHRDKNRETTNLIQTRQCRPTLLLEQNVCICRSGMRTLKQIEESFGSGDGIGGSHLRRRLKSAANRPLGRVPIAASDQSLNFWCYPNCRPLHIKYGSADRHLYSCTTNRQLFDDRHVNLASDQGCGYKAESRPRHSLHLWRDRDERTATCRCSVAWSDCLCLPVGWLAFPASFPSCTLSQVFCDCAYASPPLAACFCLA